MTGVLQDLRYAARTLAKSPGFAAAAIVILALGIGANTAIFSLIDAVVLHPLPSISRQHELFDLVGDTVSYPLYRALAADARGTARMGAWSGRQIALNSGGEPEMVRGIVASGSYFDVLGVRATQGRLLLSAEERSGEAVVILSDGLWKRRFGADASVVGRTISLNGSPFTVIGVAPPGFRGPAFGVFPDLWVPIGAWPRLATGAFAKLDIERRTWGWLRVFGRLEPGVPTDRAAVVLLATLRRDAVAHGEEFDASGLSIAPTRQSAAGSRSAERPGRLFGILAGAVTAGLLIACANLANLLLARTAGREREIAVRQALGASRRRLVQQLLSESFLLALAGGAAGLLVAIWSLGLLTQVPLPGGFTLSRFEPELGPRALVFSLALSTATALAFGLVPALKGSRTAIVSSLKLSAATLSPRSALKGALVATQVALCLVLLATGGLLARSLRNALAIDLGFRSGGATLAQINLGLARYDGARAEAFVAELRQRLAQRPGVSSASWTGIVALSGDRDRETFEAEGYVPARGEQPLVDVAVVGADYFRTLRIPVLAGREFQDAIDREGSPAVAIVNEAMAKRYWPGASPLGRRLTVDAPRTIVGVVRDTRFNSLSEPGVPQAYAPVSQLPVAALSALTLIVRTDLRPAPAAALVRAEIRRLDPALPVASIQPYDQVIASRLLPQRLGSALLGLFGALSLVLAAVGIYAAVSWSVRLRTREVGIRMALGARPREVQTLVLRQTVAPLAVGLTAGLALAAVAARLLSGVLYGVAQTDPLTFGAAAMALSLCALFAAWLPARRASRIDPITALRTE